MWGHSLPIPRNNDRPTDLPVIQDNLRRLLKELVAKADQRLRPTVQMAQDWHRRIYRGVPLPVDYYAGEIRDSELEFPELIGYEVRVGSRLGVPSSDVPQALRRFEIVLQRAVETLDRGVPASSPPPSSQELHSVLTLCAVALGEWVRIHPFANGNGRTARLWANWCALRYGLPPFVRLKPRPEGANYAMAAAESMAGEHSAMFAVFLGMLEDRLSGG